PRSRPLVDQLSFQLVSLASRTPQVSSSSLEPKQGKPDDTRWMLDHCGQRIPRSNNFRNCVVQRSGEKRVLTWFVVLADLAIPLLMMKASEQREVLGLLHSVLLPNSGPAFSS